MDTQTAMSRSSGQLRRVLERLFQRPDGSLVWRRLLILAVLFGLYLLIQPWIVRTFGVSIPGFADLAEKSGVTPSEVSAPEAADTAARKRQAGQEDDGRETAVVPASSRNGSANRPSRPSAAEVDESKAPSHRTGAFPTLAGFLRPVGNDIFESPAGLRYARGSAQGHRLKHVLAHARDNPERSGQHGVFDPGDDLTVFQLVDEAYEQACAGTQTKTKREGKRTVYTVDLGRRIGYVGGQSGKRRNHPPARHVRLVLQGQNVITAFPLIP